MYRLIQELDALQRRLRETVKAVAEELDTKPSVLNKAIRTAYKRDNATQDDMAQLEDILDAVGHWKCHFIAKTSKYLKKTERGYGKMGHFDIC